jgi:hypothetical protein
MPAVSINAFPPPQSKYGLRCHKKPVRTWSFTGIEAHAWLDRRILSSVGDDEERSVHREAEDFLRDTLAWGKKPAKEVQREARGLGINS